MGPRKRAKRNPAAEDSSSSGTALMAPPRRSRADSAAAAIPKLSGKSVSMPSQQGTNDGEGKKGEDPRPTAVTNSSSVSVTASSQSSSKQVGTRLPAVITGLSRASATAAASTDTKIRKSQSWYGSWPRKSGPSTQIARETILGGTLKPSKTADFSRFERMKNSEAMSIDEPPQAPTSTQAIPTIPENTTKSAAAPAPAPATANKDSKAPPPESTDTYKIAVVDSAPAQREEDKDAVAPREPETQAERGPRPSASSGWLGGWFKSTEPSSATTPNEPERSEVPKAVDQEQQLLPPKPDPPAQPQDTAPAQADTSSGGLWYTFWSKPTTQQPEAKPPATVEPEGPSTRREAEDVVMKDAPPVEAPSEPQPKAGSTWAFWSRESGSSKTSSSSNAKSERGELAVIGESSESHPKMTSSMEIKDSALVKEPPLKSARKDDQLKLGTSPSKDTPVKKSKRGRPPSMEIDEQSLPSRPTTPTNARAEASTKAGTPKTQTSATAKSPSTAKTNPPNLLLPSFRGTYRMKENPSILKQIAQLLLRTQSPQANHVFLSKDGPQIKKAIAIGVHGLFPAQYLRAMIGQPTGTSIRFANHCAEAIRRWTNAHGFEDCEIEKIALEGEGKIGERVENLWRLLLNWIDHIRHADMIIVACHSQGVPVGIMLLAKLIELGIVAGGVKIGVCAMAGVSLGPFPEYRSGMGMLMGSANELWEFANPKSEVSQRLEVAVQAVLSYGARITYVGSIDDQLVPLESAFYSPAHHPYIYRAVFIDGRIHAPDFIAHLVGFALKLRNLGISDQGLIRELSIPLAGSLYGGEGHSRLYDEDQVYDLAVVHTLETTDVDNVPCEIHKHEGLTNPNPYHLPWIMRGLLEQDFVKTELYAETAELLRQFDDWKPVNKALKDVKYRLEAVRSKL